ncbi:type II toxin-antitoxin system RelE/ParE family toxin [Leptospira kmetyi]|uniref:Plasmid maintenance system killer n=1 Tax=Leptospira kmetyi TaxID=408139 RepID=A0ABX4NAK0_9LEPT|nr:type II toxin-antitoxin system RelE/ParE family toxin [Leptospira kmetyi]PJZ30339.1 plasmid maintenance system killer [Leptospira kmetyi]TGK15056.1 type II toxin-antitoxin system RelE/ParE family toxin [Leptospira kmetyi]TGK25449.1 type II toxin-antitoxin system RelE/ParE family toxin [Leptospira kmetyi]
MIQSFKDKDTAKIWEGLFVKSIPNQISEIALRKLRMIHNSLSVENLKSPPGNKLEILSGNRKGQYSIRINDQWRVCFRWNEKGAHDVEITDYH